MFGLQKNVYFNFEQTNNVEKPSINQFNKTQLKACLNSQFQSSSFAEFACVYTILFVYKTADVKERWEKRFG